MCQVRTMTGRMRTSAAGLELIKTFEGLRDTAVRLPDGRWTIGYGHVRTAREGLTVTQKDAEALLVQDLKPIESAVSAMIFAPLMQGQFDALVSLAYNISMGQFRESEIVGHLNAGNYLAAANGFDLWRKARLHGRVMVVDALVRRRAAEKALFLDHPSGPPSAPTPMVTPEMDFGSAEPPRAMPANRNDVEEPEEAPAPRTAPPSDIAEAVRRLAETTQQAIRPAQELSLPPGVVVVPDKIVDEPRVVEPEPVVEAVQEIAPEPVVERKPFVAPEPVQ
ncbi:MAG: glycoside hydrolase family protein, partial [Caulobacter sp.]